MADLSAVRAVTAGGAHSLYVKADHSLWSVGKNTNGQLGDGTTTDRTIPVRILTGLQMQPKRVTVNATAGGATTGAGTYDLNATPNLVATPNLGYLFTGWTGGVTSSDANVTVTANAHLEVNATFVQDVADNDGDGLSNYAEKLANRVRIMLAIK